ncbi:MAG: DNA-3-methyladenine glycosylase 2 family protein [Planctomycetes bacterium]|nr:DNA-3-methyladenine glycosylase 2 family protein [Planctomycetota bacterium]
MKPSPADLRALARRDPSLGRAMRRLPPFPGFPGAAQREQRTHFHALARAILFQQLHWKAATTIHDRVVALTPGRGFPKAEELLALESAALRGAGVSSNKERALRDLARRVHERELDLRALGRKPDEHVVAALTEVHGIGEWSAQMFLMFRLGRLDVMPCGDLGIQEGVKRLDGLRERPTPKQVLARSEAWAPLRSVASWYLYRLTDAK